jgi:AcrR family transcriptional regulator
VEHGVPYRKPESTRVVADARVERSRAGLRDALLNLLEARPLELVTIRDIAAAAGVGYTTYFRHYPSKDALLQEVAADEVRRLSDLTTPVYDASDPHAACLALCEYVGERKRLWSALLTGAPGFVREEMLARGRRDAAVRHHGWLPKDLGVVLGVAVIIELLAWWLRQDPAPPAAYVAEILDRTAISPSRPEGLDWGGVPPR